MRINEVDSSVMFLDKGKQTSIDLSRLDEGDREMLQYDPATVGKFVFETEWWQWQTSSLMPFIDAAKAAARDYCSDQGTKFARLTVTKALIHY